MKHLLLSLLLFCTLPIFAQSKPADTLQFNQRPSRSANQWVVFPGRQANTFTYGFIYVDAMAGFTFQVAGNFSIGADDNYIVDTAARAKLRVSMYKIRLAPNTRPVAILPKKHYSELDITGDPTWLKIYNTYTDTLAHNVAIGRHLNSMNDPELAITYLLKTYKLRPHEPGCEFELGYAYNVIHHLDDAIAVLEPALKNKPDDIFMYKELGYAYLEKKDIEKAIEIYKVGITACGDGHVTEKVEMAMNIGAGYRYLKNDELYKEWDTKAKSWAPVNSPAYKQLTQMGF